MTDGQIIVMTAGQLEELLQEKFAQLKEHITAELHNIQQQPQLIQQQEDIMDIDALKDFTKWSKQYIYTLCCKQLIPHYKKGGRLYFRKSEIREYLCSDRVSSLQDIDRKATTYAVINRKKR